MSWQDYFPYIVIPNLPERTDRLERITEMLYKYGIQANIWVAHKHEDGKLGLIITMKEIFEHCLKNKIDRVFIMEDDCDIIVDEGEFHSVMDNCCEDLSNINWDCFYAGLQHPEHFARWETPNLLRVTQGYSTHSVGYSKRAMEFISSSHIAEPIDNYMVRFFQKYRTSFCSYPILTTQSPSYSDIYKDYIDWRPVIEPTYNKYVRNILPNRFKQNI